MPKKYINPVDEHVKTIKKMLKKYGTYNEALEPQIKSLASAMRNLDLANSQIDGLVETTVLEETRYGEKLAPHPVFKVAKEAQELITRQMKALHLTVEDLGGGSSEDPMCDLTKKLNRKRQAPTVIKPKED